MRIVLFQVATEFHYLVANSLIEKYYSDNDIQVVFALCKTSGRNTRLDGLNLEQGYKYFELDYDHNIQKYNAGVTDFKAFFQENKIFHFVSFLYHDPLFVYLTYYLKTKGTITFLAPDGMGAYHKFTTHNLRSRVLNSINSYKFFRKLGLKFPKLWLTSWDFGHNGYYDFIYAYSKELPYVAKSKKIIEIDYSFSEASLAKMKLVYGVDFEYLGDLKNILLLINYRKNTPKYDSKLIELFAQRFPDFKIFVKTHPDQTASDLKHLDGINNLTILNKVFPIELLIASLKNSIIVSPFSNSLLYHNQSCLYFWTYPIVEKEGEFNKPGLRFNPKSYIKIVESYSDLLDSINIEAI